MKLAEPLLQAAGLALWGLEIQDGPVIKVCLYVDVADGADGNFSASIDQCEAISRQLGLALEVEDCFPRRWVLEVSSPGLDRIFFILPQMEKYVGDMVEARLTEPLAGTKRKVWQGTIASVGTDSFLLNPATVTGEGEVMPENTPPVKIPWALVARARRVPVFSLPQKPGKKSGPGSRKQ